MNQIISFLGLGSKYSEAQILELLQNLSMEAMKTNEAVDDTELMIKLGMFKAGEGSFVRKGKTGGFREIFGRITPKKNFPEKKANKIYVLFLFFRRRYERPDGSLEEPVPQKYGIGRERIANGQTVAGKMTNVGDGNEAKRTE